MALWVTTIILPSPLETNRPAKPHCCRSVYSSLIASRHHEATHTRSAFSPHNMGARHCTKLQQNSAVSWHEQTGVPGTSFLLPPCWLPGAVRAETWPVGEAQHGFWLTVTTLTFMPLHQPTYGSTQHQLLLVSGTGLPESLCPAGASPTT